MTEKRPSEFLIDPDRRIRNIYTSILVSPYNQDSRHYFSKRIVIPDIAEKTTFFIKRVSKFCLKVVQQLVVVYVARDRI